MSTSEGQEEGIEGERPCRPALGLAPRNPGGPLSPLSHVTCRWGRWGLRGQPRPARMLGRAGFAFLRLKWGRGQAAAAWAGGPRPAPLSSSPFELARAPAWPPSVQPSEVWRSWQREHARTPSPKGSPRRAEWPWLVWAQSGAPRERVCPCDGHGHAVGQSRLDAPTLPRAPPPGLLACWGWGPGLACKAVNRLGPPLRRQHVGGTVRVVGGTLRASWGWFWCALDRH